MSLTINVISQLSPSVLYHRTKSSSRKSASPSLRSSRKCIVYVQHSLLPGARKSQAQGAAALQLKSSATLGTGKAVTHQERIKKEEHHEAKRTMEGSMGNKKRKRSSKQYAGAATDSEDEGDVPVAGDSLSSPVAEPDTESGKTRANPVVIIDSGFSTAKHEPEPALVANISYIGSALKRAPDGSVVAPRVVKRKAKTKAVSNTASFPVAAIKVESGVHIMEGILRQQSCRGRIGRIIRQLRFGVRL